MSIVKLERVTLMGLADDKDRVLGDLQEIGCLHLIPLTDGAKNSALEGASPKAREALKFLLSCPRRWRQSTCAEDFDPKHVEERALEIQRRLLDLQDEKDALVELIEKLLPFGDFVFPTEEDLGGFRLWLYEIPDHQLEQLEAADVAWTQVHHENRSNFVAVLSKTRPEGLAAEPVEAGTQSLGTLEKSVEKIQMDIEDLGAERAALSRWLSLYMRNLDRLEDHAALNHAKTLCRDTELLFAVHGWAPEASIDALSSYASRNGLALDVQSPSRDETPPVSMENTQQLSFGEKLLAFYQLPGYHDVDPSSMVFISFALFFAMILADAGYGAVLGLGLLCFWKKLGGDESGKGLRRLMTWVVVASVIFGAMLGSYFGMSPDPQSLLGRLKIMDINNFAAMMKLSILVGGLHLILANGMNAWHRRSGSAALAPLGWVAIVAGGLTAYVGLETPAVSVGAWTMVVGSLLVLMFSGRQPIRRPGDVIRRFADGLKGLAGFSGMFGDILSYLRLFALGLASGSLGMTLNSLAGQVSDMGSRKGIALLLGLLVLLLGHALNLSLGIIGGVVHGLRLNLIEFYKWSVFEEGTAFQAFRKKENVTWKP